MIFDQGGWFMMMTTLLVFFLALGRIRTLPNPLEIYTELTRLELEWLAAGNHEMTSQKLPVEVPFPELGLSNKETLKMIADTLYCASEPLKDKRCSSYATLGEHGVIVRIHAETQSLFFGYSFFVNKPPISPDHRRLIIYRDALEIWEHVVETALEHPNYQQFHVGYRTGGSLAALIAFRMVSSRALPFFKARNNSANQIKVLTLSQFPIFSHRILFNPIGDANFAVLREANEHLPNEKKDEFLDMGTLIILKGYKSDPLLKKLDRERLLEFVALKANARVNLDSMKDKHYNALKRDVAMRLAFIKDVADDLVKVFPDMAHHLYGQGQNVCVNELEQLLHDFLPHPYSYEIVCQVRDRQGATLRMKKAEFIIQCSLRHNNPDDNSDSSRMPKRVVFAEYDARLAPMGEKAKTCGQMRRTVEEASEWGTCIADLVKGSYELSLVSAHSAHETDSCRFLPDLIKREWGELPRGCFIKPLTTDGMLRSIYENNPHLFYSLIDPRTMDFPETCENIMRPILYRGKQKEHVWVSMDIATMYLKSMSQDNGPSTSRRTLSVRENPRDRLPNIFRSHSTAKFKTELLKLSDTHFVADDTIARGLIKCVASKHTKFLDCTKKANQWIPDACPDFCTSDKKIDICEIVAWCEDIGAFVGATNVAVPLWNGALVESTLEALEATNMAQFAIYRYAQENYINQLIKTKDHYLGVFFPKFPEIERVEPEHLTAKRGRGRKKEDDERDIWHDYTGVRPDEDSQD